MQEAGLLDLYLTGFYYKPAATAPVLRFLPRRWRRMVERELNRRHHVALKPDKIRSHPIVELGQVLAGRMVRSNNPSLMLYRNRNFQKWASRIISQRRPSAVIAYDTSALELFRSAKQIRSLCILDQTIAERSLGLELMENEAVLHPEWSDSLTIEHMRATESLACAEAKAADVVLAGSEFVRESLARRGVPKSKITVLPYGAEPNKTNLVEQDNSIFTIIFVGSVSQRKGIKYLLEAVKRLGLPNLNLNVVGSILGDPTHLEPYRRSASFLGNVPRSEVADYLADADICVYPSIFEGSALAVYEAMAAGLAVITTPNSGSVVRDGIDGYVVPIRDVDALAAKIKLLYDDRALTRLMGANARDRAREFTWQTYRKRLAAIVTNIIEAGDEVQRPASAIETRASEYSPAPAV